MIFKDLGQDLQKSLRILHRIFEDPQGSWTGSSKILKDLGQDLQRSSRILEDLGKDL